MTAQWEPSDRMPAISDWSEGGVREGSVSNARQCRSWWGVGVLVAQLGCGGGAMSVLEVDEGVSWALAERRARRQLKGPQAYRPDARVAGSRNMISIPRNSKK